MVEGFDVGIAFTGRKGSIGMLGAAFANGTAINLGAELMTAAVTRPQLKTTAARKIHIPDLLSECAIACATRLTSLVVVFGPRPQSESQHHGPQD